MKGSNALRSSVIILELEGIPVLIINEKKTTTFRQNNYFNLVLLCFETNPLRGDSLSGLVTLRSLSTIHI